MNLRNVGDSKFTACHTVLVEMCLHLKPTGFSSWVVHSVHALVKAGSKILTFPQCKARLTTSSASCVVDAVRRRLMSPSI